MTFTAETLEIWIVGGWVRDRLSGHESHDLDVVAVHPAGFDDLERQLVDAGGVVHKRDDGTLTLRVEFPQVLQERFGVKNGDVVLARFDGPYTDGRHPDFTRPGTLVEDLARRDLTVNAIAFNNLTGEFCDPHGGRQDLEDGVLRFVGDPVERIREDALRVLRALRFAVTKNLTMTQGTWDAINSDFAAEMLLTLPIERVDTEITRMLVCDSLASIKLLVEADKLHGAVFRNNFHLEGALKVRKVAQ